MAKLAQAKAFILIALSLTTVALVRADNVAITSGSIIGQRTYGANGPNSGSLSLQGTNFSLSLASYPGGITPFVTVNADQTVTYSYSLGTTIPGFTLVYNGTTYNANGQDVLVNFWFDAGNVIVPNLGVNGAIQASASIQVFVIGRISYGPVSIVFTGNANCAVSSTGMVAGPETDSANCQFQPVFSPFSIDTATQGTWNGRYGGAGYAIPNGPSNLQNFYFGITGASTYTWGQQTTDVRALQDGANATTRMASTYTAPSFSLNVATRNYTTQRLALYLLDFDTSNTRSETIDILDTTYSQVTGTTVGSAIDSRTVSDFSQGKWLIWDGLPSNYTISITGVNGSNAVLSGIFFGPAGPPSVGPPPTSSATFAGIDTSTKGFWQGVYGGKGYAIANGASQPVSYGVFAVNGDITYTWAGQTTDPRALETTPGYGIASAYTQYTGKSFTIHVDIADGAAHKISLYLLDWDTTARSQTITITDASTNALLDTQTFTGFHNGEYASWVIGGNVNIKVTPNGSTSPAVSGIFFN